MDLNRIFMISQGFLRNLGVTSSPWATPQRCARPTAETRGGDGRTGRCQPGAQGEGRHFRTVYSVYSVGNIGSIANALMEYS